MANVADGRTITVVGHVTLLFKVSGIEEAVVPIIPCLVEECYQGANFIRIFQAIHDPTIDKLQFKAEENYVSLEVAVVSLSQLMALASIGLIDLQTEEAKKLQKFLERALPTDDGPLAV